MPGIKISALPPAVSVLNANLFAQVAAGVTEKATVTQLRANLGFDTPALGDLKVGPSFLLAAGGASIASAGSSVLSISAVGDVTLGDNVFAPVVGATFAITPPLDRVGLSISGFSLNGANAQSILDLAGTWNTSGTPTAIKLVITDTLSNAASLLMDLRTAAASRFAVNKAGDAIVANGIRGGGGFLPFYMFGSGGAVSHQMTSGAFVVISDAAVIGMGVSTDAIIARDAANAIALRNGANAQTLNIYGTFTDAANYEKGFARWSTGVFQIGVAVAGTGTTRAMSFFTNNTARWTVNTSGHFMAGTDDTYDIGGIAATRPRNGYFSQYLHWGGQTRVTADFAVTNSAALTNITGLTVNVLAGNTYEFRAILHLTAAATGGVKLAMGGTCTATAIRYQIEIISDTTNILAVSATQNALGGASGVQADTSYFAEVTGTITVNAGGTLTVQLAENTAVGATSATALQGSIFRVNEY